MIGEVTSNEHNQANALPVQAKRAEYGDRVENRKLTRGEVAVLRVLMDPSNAEKTDIDRMKLAGVGNDTWYRVVRDPYIQRKQREMAQEYIRSAVAPMLKQSIQVATSEKRDGFNDRKLLLEMSGFYVPRQQIDHTTAGQPIVGVVGVDPQQL
jgi:hypothetical protein